MPYSRSDRQKASDKSKGDEAEANFIEHLSLMGANASVTGKIPLDYYNFPRMQFPAKWDEDNEEYYGPRQVAPDVVFWWQEFPIVSMAQVKAKELHGKIIDGSAFFYLDEAQLFKMNCAARSGARIIFVVYCEEMGSLPGLSTFSFVDIRDLQEDRITLHKIDSFGKPTFKIPVTVLKPISELRGHITNEALSFPNEDNGGGEGSDPRRALAA